MKKKTRIQFNRQQIEQQDDLLRQTSETREELVRRAVDFYFCGIRENGARRALHPPPLSDTKKARRRESRPTLRFVRDYKKRRLCPSPTDDVGTAGRRGA